MNNGKAIRYFESPYYPPLLNNFYFSSNILVLAASAKIFSVLLLLFVWPNIQFVNILLAKYSDEYLAEWYLVLKCHTYMFEKVGRYAKTFILFYRPRSYI